MQLNKPSKIISVAACWAQLRVTQIRAPRLNHPHLPRSYSFRHADPDHRVYLAAAPRGCRVLSVPSLLQWAASHRKPSANNNQSVLIHYCFQNVGFELFDLQYLTFWKPTCSERTSKALQSRCCGVARQGANKARKWRHRVVQNWTHIALGRMVTLLRAENKKNLKVITYRYII